MNTKFQILKPSITVIVEQDRTIWLTTRAVFLAKIVVKLARGPARTDIGHHPEVCLVAHAEDSILGAPDLFDPDVACVLILMMNGDDQSIRIDAELFGDELPSALDRLALEVITKRKISEHLEECVMPRTWTHVLQVVVLPADAHAFLTRCGARVSPLLLSHKDVLEWDHPCVDEQERGIVWHERCARNDLVVSTSIELKESAAHFGAGWTAQSRLVQTGRHGRDRLVRRAFRRIIR